MIQAWRDSTESPARRPHSARLAGLFFALFVMCLAVVPHLTLAASMMSAGMPGHAVVSPHSTVLSEAGKAPCHEGAATPAAHTKAPPCCIVGCGLIAEAPSAPFLPLDGAWSRAAPPAAAPVRGLTPEPAEHPPRTRAAIA